MERRRALADRPAGGCPFGSLCDTQTGERRPWKEIRPPVLACAPIQRFLMGRDGETYVYQAFRVVSELYLVEGLMIRILIGCGGRVV